MINLLLHNTILFVAFFLLGFASAFLFYWIFQKYKKLSYKKKYYNFSIKFSNQIEDVYHCGDFFVDLKLSELKKRLNNLELAGEEAPVMFPELQNDIQKNIKGKDFKYIGWEVSEKDFILHWKIEYKLIDDFFKNLYFFLTTIKGIENYFKFVQIYNDKGEPTTIIEAKQTTDILGIMYLLDNTLK